jgi:hypothetical protein
MTQCLARHLGLSTPPDDLNLWNLGDCSQLWGQKGHGLEELIQAVRPDLVIIDTLSGQFPQAEGKNETANSTITRLRAMMRKCHTSFLIVHHLRKPNEERGAVRLEDGDLRSFFNQVRGASSLINGCDIRLAADAPGVASFLSGNEQVALVVRGYGRVSGEIPTLRLARVHDEDGEPLGYDRLSGVALLGNSEQQAAFNKLPPAFRFTGAKHSYGKASQPTTDFLNKCISAGILRKTPNGYEKIDQVIQESGSGGLTN